MRTGFDMASDKASVLQVGTVITALETRVNEGGTVRVHFEGGWVSETAGNGVAILEKLPDPGAAAASTASTAPAGAKVAAR